MSAERCSSSHIRRFSWPVETKPLSIKNFYSRFLIILISVAVGFFPDAFGGKSPWSGQPAFSIYTWYFDTIKYFSHHFHKSFPALWHLEASFSIYWKRARGLGAFEGCLMVPMAGQPNRLQLGQPKTREILSVPFVSIKRRKIGLFSSGFWGIF